ncbi:hypothetical protein [Roseibium sp.]|uniref:hypothetical protein n=1 Tax=Roseibium sp. TaxID=1936156 RepID=UPI003B511163
MIVLLFLFGPYIFFGAGLLVGVFWPIKPIGKANGVISVFSFPLSFIAILLLTLSLVPGSSGPNSLGLGYVFVAPLFLFCSPLIFHAGWIIARLKNKMLMPKATHHVEAMVYEVERFEGMDWKDANYPFRLMNVGDLAEFSGYHPHTAVGHARKWEEKLRVQFRTLPSQEETRVIIERVK